MAKAAEIVQLKPETLLAFQEYIRDAEAYMERTLSGEIPFLWVDASEDRALQVRKGRTLAQLWSDKRPVKAPEGLIHDWIGATRIPGVTIAQTLGLIQDYDNHKNIYKSEVLDSKLIERCGDDFKIYLRLLKKKVITVVLDTDHDVHYFAVDPTRWCCRSYTTRIVEVGEKTLPPDTGHGFLWRLNSYWRFFERDGGVDAECRAISLTRDVPKGLGWIIEPIVRKLPRESLISTLESTRKALTKPGA